MQCEACGEMIPDGSRACPHCDEPLPNTAGPAMHAAPVPAPDAVASQPSQACGLATWSMVLGIVGIPGSLLCIGVIAALGAVICGHLARAKIRAADGRLGGNGRAVTGLVLGYLGIFLFVVLLMGAATRASRRTRTSASPEDAARIARLLQEVKSPEYLTRLQAVRELGDLAERAQSAYVAVEQLALSDPQEGVRRRAVMALSAISDSSPSLRRQAKSVLGRVIAQESSTEVKSRAEQELEWLSRSASVRRQEEREDRALERRERLEDKRAERLNRLGR